MITNATITRIDTFAEGTGGTKSWTDGASISARCALDQPRTGQKWVIGAEVKDATAALYVQDMSLAFQVQGRVAVRLDGEEAERTYRILFETPRVKPGLRHREVFLGTI